jgi:hypothetical protein
VITGVRAYFAGLVIGLLALSLIGMLTTRINQFSSFTRFHRYLNPETYFYPTASQVVALARDAAGPDQTAVIIGGSSIMFGSGQGENELWTNRLQEDLGDEFGVVNLAFPAGAPSEHGATAAQALLKANRDVVFIAHVFPGTNGPDGIVYPYVAWDAEARGMLFPLPSRDSLWDEKRLELRVRARLDSLLYFTDLWTSLGYHCCMTVWNYLTPSTQNFFSARSEMPDPLPVMPESGRYNPATDDAAMRVVNAEQIAWCGSKDSLIAGIDGSISTVLFNLPPEVLERSIFLVMHRSPYYTNRLDTSGQACRIETFRLVAGRIQQAGYHALVMGEDWTSDDYTDLVHPSGAGGIKMAKQVAPLIREMRAARSHEQ